jgi:MYXO-CTERM domain-containing protein
VTVANNDCASVDFQNHLWIASQVAAGGNQNLFEINVTSGTVIASLGIGALPSFPINATPFLLGDFTGVQLNRQAPYAKLGSWSNTYDGGTAAIPWAKATWNTEPAGAVPALTSLSVSIRAADTPVALATAAYSPVQSGVAISGIKGRYVQVQAALTGPGFVTPVLSDVTVTGPCPTTGSSCCLSDADCYDGNSCTTDTCPAPGGTCQHAPVQGCCLTNADCDDQNACTADNCPVPGGQCAFAPISGCCNSNVDCDDGDPCSVDVCSGPGGTCSHPLINGCCLTNIDCTKGNVCSNATCPVPGGFCQGGNIPGCCTADSDCTDNDLCTADACDTSTSTCMNVPIAGCCTLDAQCDDGDPCTADSCSGPGGNCVHSIVPNCCSPSDPKVGTPCDVPQAPDDHLPCKAGAWACTGATFVCQGSVVPHIEACNGIDDDCDGTTDPPSSCPSGETCVKGICVAMTGHCAVDADCDDGDLCTTDTCSFAGGTCAHEAIPSCCKTDADCPNGICQNHWCSAMPPDAGGLPDAAGGLPDAAESELDASASSPDASPLDASTSIAADASDNTAADVGVATAADVGSAPAETADGSPASTSPAGCGCGAAGQSQAPGAALLMLVLAVFGARRRRLT